MSADVRSGIVDFLFRELVGPDPGFPAQQLNREEILRPQDPPRLRYSAGVLFPRKVALAVAETATEAEAEANTAAGSVADDLENEDTGLGDPRADARGEGEVPTDQEVNRANEYLPSAMGVSALLRLPRNLKIRVVAAAYTREVIEGLGHTDRDGRWQPHWFRRPVEFTLNLDCSDFKAANHVVRQFRVMNGDLETSLTCHVFSRPHVLACNPESDRIVTFTLLNNRIAQSQRPRDEECYFQCGIDITGAEGEVCFLEYPDRIGISLDKEEQSLRLLYSHLKTFAVGHGCSANWDYGTADKVSRIWTQSLPSFEIKPIVPRQIEGLDLSMLALSAADADSIALCGELAEGYQRWICEREMEADRLPEEQKDAAWRHLGECREALRRMRGGIELLVTHELVNRAFALMNRAMLAQQVHYDLASNPQKQRRWVKRANELTLERP